MTPAEVRKQLASLAAREGFAHVSFAEAAPLADARAAATAALEDGRLATMTWMDHDWVRRATNPATFLGGARTVMVLALPVAPLPESEADLPTSPTRGRIARYAAGRDYHRVFEPKLRRIVRAIRQDFKAQARGTVDYGPLLERPWAARSGLGWQGKSTMLLIPGLGPWALLGVVVTDLSASPDEPLRKSCGSCTRCIVACPTGAISPQGDIVDARLCISYHTIENRGSIPRGLRASFGDWIFGCDDCLTSCPVGRNASQSAPELVPAGPDGARPALAPLLALDDAAFVERFRGRPIMRAKRDGLLRNVCVALGNAGAPGDLAALELALSDASPLVRGHAAWAIHTLALRHGLRAQAAALLLHHLGSEQDPFVRDERDFALSRLAADTPAR
ncbi:MAG: tRNA epoxyqueuosine(34) reductase QueG [Dehalococcoidia bacterium]|nr:tRNA epoxyqueuosine(34) reductase QueG [Dehalococcoidia bacterium]MCB9486235.1 tRNA epoxyqueuosine(34) reductase QueG [Thermoflexaceae bacterium]